MKMKPWKIMRRRGLALFLAVILCLNLAQLSAFAEERTENTNEPTSLPFEADLVGKNVADQLLKEMGKNLPEDGSWSFASQDGTVFEAGDGSVFLRGAGTVEVTYTYTDTKEENEADGQKETAPLPEADQETAASEPDPAEAPEPAAEAGNDARNEPEHSAGDMDEVQDAAESSAEPAAEGESEAVDTQEPATEVESEPVPMAETPEGMYTVARTFTVSLTVEKEEQLEAAFSKGGTYTVIGNFPVRKQLTIPENVAVVLNLNGYTITGSRRGEAGKNFPLFRVNSGAELTLNGTGVIQGNNEESNKGALITVVYGTLNIRDDVTLTGNSNPEDGGAIFNLGGTVNISGGAITSCSAQNGGAISSSSGAVNITGGRFENNTAEQRGGALYAGGAVTVTGGSFTGNTAGDDAKDNDGAAYGAGSITVPDSLTFKKEIGTISSLDELRSALENGGEYIVTADIAAKITSCLRVQGKNVVLNLNGHTITANRGGEEGKNENFPLFRVNSGAELTLNGTGVIQGGDGELNKGALITVVYGTLNIRDDVTLTGNSNPEDGGAIFTYNGTVNMTGGKISNCSAQNGGAIYGSGGKINLSGGTITNNTATASAAYSQVTSHGGGGIYMESGALTISGGEISGNKAGGGKYGGGKHGGGGGGVYIGKSASLVMSGGEIIGNLADREGGGIFVGSENGNSITGGKITGNVTQTAYDWGGGGIFVDAGASLNIRQALITENTSNGVGAGVSGCPHAKVKLYANQGAAIYDNMVQPVGGELTWLVDGRAHEKDPIPPAEQAGKDAKFNGCNSADFYCAKESTVESIMLGGTDAQWTGLKAAADSATGASEEVTPKSFTNGSLSYTGLLGLTATAPKKSIGSLAAVEISGNRSATHGGGVGCNGILTFGVETTAGSLTVSKVVTGNGDRNQAFPFTVTLDPYPADITCVKTNQGGGESNLAVPESGEITFSLKNGERVEISSLPIGTTYTVVETDPSGHTVSYEPGNTGTIIPGNSAPVVTVTNHIPSAPEPVKGSLTIAKALNADAPEAARTRTYTFTVTGPDGYRGTVTITGAGSQTLSNLEPGTYTVTEENAELEGYTLKVTGDGVQTVSVGEGGSRVSFTNTYTKAPGSLTLTKALNEDAPEAAASHTYTFTVTGPEGYRETVTITGAGSQTLTGLEPGAYTVTEDTGKAAIPGYTLNVTEGTEQRITITAEEESEALVFTNVYTPDDTPKGSLTVTKVIAGELPEEAEDMSFSFTVTGPNGYRTAFTLRNGESLTLTELAAGEYTVTEDVDGAAIAGRRLYVTGGGTVTVPEGGTGAVTVTNEYLRPELPDPNDPDSPDTVTIWDDDVPKTYVKVWDPEDEEWEWIPEEDVPLMNLDIPDTGDTNAVVRWGLLTLAALAGVIVLFFTERRAKKQSK